MGNLEHEPPKKKKLKLGFYYLSKRAAAVESARTKLRGYIMLNEVNAAVTTASAKETTLLDTQEESEEAPPSKVAQIVAKTVMEVYISGPTALVVENGLVPPAQAIQRLGQLACHK